MLVALAEGVKVAPRGLLRTSLGHTAVGMFLLLLREKERIAEPRVCTSVRMDASATLVCSKQMEVSAYIYIDR